MRCSSRVTSTSALRRRFGVVLDAQPAADVDVVDRDARGFHGLDQVEQAVERVEIGFHLRDLRADVAIDAHHLQPGQAGRAAVAGHRLVMRDAELVVLQAGGDVGVRAGVDVGVDAQADLRRAPFGHGHLRQQVQLALALDVEAAHAGLQRAAHLGAGLADAREHHLRGLAAGRQHAFELAGRDDVEAAAGLREGLQHGQAGVGLHRITKQVRPAGQRALVGGYSVEHRALRIHIQRRAEFARQGVERAAVEAQFGAAARQVRGARQAHRGRRRRGRRCPAVRRAGQGQRALLAAARSQAQQQAQGGLCAPRGCASPRR